MNPPIRRPAWRWWFVLLGLLALGMACGVKAPPRPPLSQIENQAETADGGLDAGLLSDER
ncbi:MAG: hypothetical protein JRF33_07740 [Deltaproteobacteria bacterium]|nr:hypothetical protein [Deltaproteobacteria bacterium]